VEAESGFVTRAAPASIGDVHFPSGMLYAGPANALPAPEFAVTEDIRTDLCVIGAGSGGLSVAAAAAMMQVPVVLIEKGEMGGDCLNVGCVPSKALIAAGKAAAEMRRAAAFGFAPVEIKPNHAKVMAHVKGVIEAIAPNDSEHRFRSLGCRVIRAPATFVEKRVVEAGGFRIRARRFVIATGSRPAVPPIPGLDKVPYLTNESLFDLTKLPRRLVVIGGGPIGMEMAQAFARLGSEVTVVEAARVLAREDAEAARLVRQALVADGVTFREGVKVDAVDGAGEKLRVMISGEGGARALDCTHVLVAAGRAPVVDGLGLDAAGIAATPKGITVDAKLRTTNRKVYAIGDCIGPPQFTHRANLHAGIVIRNGLFRLPVKASDALLPRVTFTDPEIASVGLSEEQSLAAGGVRILRWPFAENDRAQAERRTEGFVKAMVDRKGRILGVTIIGHNGGELLTPWTLAMANGLKVTAMTGITFPYPTYSEATKRAATAFLMPKLLSPGLQRLLRLVRRFG
jgi:pyruvate/2-oxoglutarate dehydrogenase complex dihydrolipoamide dehydrogenase (E3) component